MDSDERKPAPAGDHGQSTGKARAAERVAAALRETLKRRKALVRARGEADRPTDASLDGAPIHPVPPLKGRERCA